MTPAIDFLGGIIVGVLLGVGATALLIFIIMAFGKAMNERSKMNSYMYWRDLLSTVELLSLYVENNKEAHHNLNEVRRACRKEMKRYEYPGCMP